VARYIVSQALWSLGTLLCAAVTAWLAYGLWLANLDGGGTLILALFAFLTYWCSEHLFA
jgi:hypothetical protein